MSEDHKMTKQDKLALGITLAAIFGVVFILGFFGVINNLPNAKNEYLFPLSLIWSYLYNVRYFDQNEFYSTQQN